MEEKLDVTHKLYNTFFLFACPKEWTNNVQVSIVQVSPSSTSLYEAVSLGLFSYTL